MIVKGFTGSIVVEFNRKPKCYPELVAWHRRKWHHNLGVGDIADNNIVLSDNAAAREAIESTTSWLCDRFLSLLSKENRYDFYLGAYCKLHDVRRDLASYSREEERLLDMQSIAELSRVLRFIIEEASIIELTTRRENDLEAFDNLLQELVDIGRYLLYWYCIYAESALVEHSIVFYCTSTHVGVHREEPWQALMDDFLSQNSVTIYRHIDNSAAQVLLEGWMKQTYEFDLTSWLDQKISPMGVSILEGNCEQQPDDSQTILQNPVLIGLSYYKEVHRSLEERILSPFEDDCRYSFFRPINHWKPITLFM